jgi:CheY-like chemotaxis protein
MTKILVIQDELTGQDNLTRRLIRRGCTIKEFAEVRPALLAAGGEAFDMVLLDLNLEDMGGWEAAKLIKEDPATRDLPMIALANEEMEGAQEIAIEAGCVDFEPRPAELERLLEKIKKAVDGKGASDGKGAGDGKTPV